MKRHIGFKGIVLILSLIVIAILAIINVKNNIDFWDVSVADLLVLIVAVVLTFFYVERKNDEYRRNTCIEYVISEICRIAVDDRIILLDENRTALMMQQTCGNKISYLKNAGFKDFDDDFLFIEKELIELRTIFSEHMDNPHNLEIVRKDLERHKQNICDKCDKIRIKLYM